MAAQGTHKEIRDQAEFLDDVLHIAFDDQSGEVNLRQTVNGRSCEQMFILDKEQDELTADGRIVRTVFTLESDEQLKQVQKHGFLETVIRRKVKDGILLASIKTGDCRAEMKFERINTQVKTGTSHAENPSPTSVTMSTYGMSRSRSTI